MQHQPPTTIISTRQSIGGEIGLSIRTDRTLVIELGRNTHIIFSPVEAKELWLYLARHHYYFPTTRRNNQ